MENKYSDIIKLQTIIALNVYRAYDFCFIPPDMGVNNISQMRNIIEATAAWSL